MKLTRLKAEVVAALAGSFEIAKLIRRNYELTDNLEDVVRVDEVAKFVAAALECEVSKTLRARVRAAAVWCGWKRVVTRGNVPYYRRMRRCGQR